MDGITFRPAAPGDIPKMIRLRMDMLLESHPDGHSVEEIALVRSNNEASFRRCLADDTMTAWLACEGDRIVATGSVSFSESPPNFHCPSGRTAYIANIYTHPAYRGRGIATEILSRCVESAKQRGCERITLNTWPAGRPIYEKYGFKTAANAMSYYPNDHIAEGSQ